MDIEDLVTLGDTILKHNDVTEVYEAGCLLETSGFTHSEIDAYLEHHGVKGMKWGVRNKIFRDNRVARSLNNVDHPRYHGKRAKAGIAVGTGIRKTVLAGKSLATRSKPKDIGEVKIKDLNTDHKSQMTAGKAYLLGGLVGLAIYKHKQKQTKNPTVKKEIAEVKIKDLNTDHKSQMTAGKAYLLGGLPGLALYKHSQRKIVKSAS